MGVGFPWHHEIQNATVRGQDQADCPRGGRQALAKGDVLLAPAPHSAPPAILFHAIVQQIDPEKLQARVHYFGWRSAYDAWLPLRGTRLLPSERTWARMTLYNGFVCAGDKDSIDSLARAAKVFRPRYA